MSKFRKLIEAIVYPETGYVYLTLDLQDALYKAVENNIDNIDPSELTSATWDSNPYDVEPQLAQGSGTWNYDEDEIWNASCENYIEKLKADGAIQYLWDLIPEDKKDDDEYDQNLTKEAIDYIEKQERN